MLALMSVETQQVLLQRLPNTPRVPLASASPASGASACTASVPTASASTTTSSESRGSTKQNSARLSPQDPDGLHLEKHKSPGQCLRCSFAQTKSDWTAKCCVDPQERAKGTWLRSLVSDDGEWRLVCSLCCTSGRGWTSDRYARLSNVLAHENTKKHRRALQRLGVEDPETLCAPSVAHFQELLDHLRKAPLGQNPAMLKAIGGRHKQRKMLWCLAEVVRTRRRKHIQNSVTMAIFQDTRDGLLTLRFSSATPGLDYCVGPVHSLFLPAEHGQDADGLRKATLDCIKRLCIVRAHPPQMAESRSGSCNMLDASLFKHAKHIVEVFVADAASDEIRAGHTLQQLGNEGGLANLRHVVRDKAHCCRRITSRAWMADQFIKDVLELFLFNKKSPANVVRWSPVFKQHFQTNVAKLESNPTETSRLRDLGYAKHRFDSTQRPVARILLFFWAYVSTASQVVLLRPGTKDGDACESFLRRLDAEVCLQLAMLGDAADEANVFLRFVDCENFDCSALSAEIDAFLARIVCLFERRQCLVTGFTRHMLSILQEQKGIKMRNSYRVLGQPGGAPPEVIERCLARMQAWVRLASRTLSVEFPHWETFIAFGILSLDEAAADRIGSATYKSHCHVLAKAAGVDEATLAEQLADFVPAARRAYEAGASVKQSWIKAIKEAQRRSNTQQLHPVTALQPVVLRYLAWGASTSGVEQGFGKQHHALGGLGTVRSEQLLNDHQDVVASHTDKKDDEELVSQARAEWVAVYGEARTSGTAYRAARMDTGKKRNCKNMSMARWVVARRTIVAQLVEKGDCARGKHIISEDPSARLGWTDRHAKEAMFIEAKRIRNLFEGVREGNVEVEHLSVADLQAVAAEMANQKRRDENYAKDQISKRRKLLCQPPDLRGRAVFFDGGLDIFGDGGVDVLAAAEMQRVTDRSMADAFIVQDMANIGRGILFCVALNGGVVASLEYAKSGGARGPATTYKRATASRRWLWLSPAFAASHAHLARVIDSACRKRGSAWTRMASKDDFLQRVGASNSKTINQCIALVNKDEVAAADLSRCRHVLTAPKLLNFITAIDMTRSVQGYCGF